VHNAETSGNRDQECFVSDSRNAVESVHKHRTKGWSLTHAVDTDGVNCLEGSQHVGDGLRRSCCSCAKKLVVGEHGWLAFSDLVYDLKIAIKRLLGLFETTYYLFLERPLP
jgi:hypothetical protein